MRALPKVLAQDHECAASKQPEKASHKEPEESRKQERRLPSRDEDIPSAGYPECKRRPRQDGLQAHLPFECALVGSIHLDLTHTKVGQRRPFQAPFLFLLSVFAFKTSNIRSVSSLELKLKAWELSAQAKV